MSTTSPRPGTGPGRAAALLLGVVGLVVVLGLVGTVVWWNGGIGTLVGRERCVAHVGATSVTLSPEQAEHAATIAAVAQRRQLPVRAVTVALATAFQESDLTNVSHGDRDSAGLFQQRPSQGWGTFAQVTDPEHATQRFFDALEQVPGWQALAVTRAAQAVQRSAYPTAYQQHADEARALAQVLTGAAPHALSCTVHAADVGRQRLGPDGLTPRAEALRTSLEDAFGPLALGGFAPGGVDRPGTSAHDQGRAIDIFLRPRGDAAQRRTGWATASWLVANASRLGVSVVIYRDHIWSAHRSPEGWRSATPASGDLRDPVERRLDHLHVEVSEGAASAPA